MKKNVQANVMVLILGLVQAAAPFRADGADTSQATTRTADVLSRAFEMRLVTGDTKADGETEFTGPTQILDTEGRIKFLRRYADYAKEFFGDPRLDTPAATDAEAARVLKTLKPQPLPTVRTVIPLTEWKYLGYRPEQEEEERLALEVWLENHGTAVVADELTLTEPEVLVIKEVPASTWRLSMAWKARVSTRESRAVFKLYDHQIDNRQVDAAVVGFDGKGQLFYRTNGEEVPVGDCEPGRDYRFKVEVDLDASSRRYNLYVDDRLVADFVPLAGEDSLELQAVNRFGIEGGKGLVVDDIIGQAYEQTASFKTKGAAHMPFKISTFIDEDFSVRPSPAGFETGDYNDEKWSKVPAWPYAHGGERYKDETLHLRTTAKIGRFQRAVLKLDGVKPSGELYINGKRIKTMDAAVWSNSRPWTTGTDTELPGVYPMELDVTPFLVPESENLIAVMVKPWRTTGFSSQNSDPWSGWFAGPMELHLTGETRIADVFAYATDAGDPAKVRLEVRLDSARAFEGTVRVEFFPWHPEPSDTAAATARFPVRLAGGAGQSINEEIAVPSPKLWTPGTPHLYKVHVTIEEKGGKPVDDEVFTTGLRTVSQEGGTFRVNGKPEMLLGPLVFQYLHPIENISRWIFCPPEQWIVKQMLMVRNQGGNAVRMHMHDASQGGHNDRRWAQIADQLGIMLIWQTSAFVREGNISKMDLEGLGKDVAARRNHPSIVMWQPANHVRATMEDLSRVFDTVYRIDASRLICPNSQLLWLVGSKPSDPKVVVPPDEDETWAFWRHPKMARGTMEQTTGYTLNWRPLRLLPDYGDLSPVRPGYLNSPTHAWFDFENEESIGQPNWSLHRGKPTYKIYSYERDYDIGTIGRVLTFDEWQEHQAYQAFSAYEAYRKKRWLDFDGLNWCCLRGGPNTGTYMKPMVDYYDAAKLSYHTVGMAFQRVLAGSRNVDTAYGPGDAIPVMVFNLGEARTVNVEVVARAEDGSVADQTVYAGVKLDGGRSVTDLKTWKPALKGEGVYAFEYTVKAADSGN